MSSGLRRAWEYMSSHPPQETLHWACTERSKRMRSDIVSDFCGFDEPSLSLADQDSSAPFASTRKASKLRNTPSSLWRASHKCQCFPWWVFHSCSKWSYGIMLQHVPWTQELPDHPASLMSHQLDLLLLAKCHPHSHHQYRQGVTHHTFHQMFNRHSHQIPPRHQLQN